MEKLYTKSIQNIDNKMRDMGEETIRFKILQSAKNFKISWVELGQALYTAWKDKLYRSWGYSTFEIYTLKEIGIKQATAMKLLKSYYFLEKEEPMILQKELSSRESAENSDVANTPGYEAVNLLRLAKANKDLYPEDYDNLKSAIFENGKDVSEVKKDLTSMIREREELSPDEAREKKRSAVIRRFVSNLNALKKEMEIEKLLPSSMLKEISTLITKIETEIL